MDTYAKLHEAITGSPSDDRHSSLQGAYYAKVTKASPVHVTLTSVDSLYDFGPCALLSSVPALVRGDTVLIIFEQDRAGQPVVIGKL